MKVKCDCLIMIFHNYDYDIQNIVLIANEFHLYQHQKYHAVINSVRACHTE